MELTQSEWDRLISKGSTKSELKQAGFKVIPDLCSGCYRNSCECIDRERDNERYMESMMLHGHADFE